MWYLIGTVVFAAVLYGMTWLHYWLNRAFILENMHALPFEYRVTLAFIHWEWWAILTALGFGFLMSWGVLKSK